MNHHRPHSFPQNPHMEQPHDPYGRNLTTGNHDLIRPTGDPGVFSENTPSGITRAWDRPTPPDNGPIRQVHAPIDPAFQERFGVSIAQSRPNSANTSAAQAQSQPEFLARSGGLVNLPPSSQASINQSLHPRAADLSPHNVTLGPTVAVRGKLERPGRPVPPQPQRLGYAPVRHAVQYPGQQMPGFVRPNRAPYQIQPMHGQQPLPETMMQPPTREMRRPEIVTDQENIDVTDRPVILQGNRRMLGGYGGGMDTYVANPKSGSLVERSMGWAQSLSDLPNGRENAILPRNVKELLEDRQFGILGEVPPYNERDNVFGALNPETRRRFYDDAEERLRQEGVTDFSPSLVQIEQNGKSWTVLCLGKDFTHDGRGMLSFAVAGNQNVDQMFQRARHAIPKVFESLPGAPIRQEATRVQHIVLPPRSE